MVYGRSIGVQRTPCTSLWSFSKWSLWSYHIFKSIKVCWYPPSIEWFGKVTWLNRSTLCVTSTSLSRKDRLISMCSLCRLLWELGLWWVLEVGKAFLFQTLAVACQVRTRELAWLITALCLLIGCSLKLVSCLLLSLLAVCVNMPHTWNQKQGSHMFWLGRRGREAWLGARSKSSCSNFSCQQNSFPHKAVAKS